MRPSSGAASTEPADAPDSITPPPLSNIAAPGDGRTPGTSPPPSLSHYLFPPRWRSTLPPRCSSNAGQCVSPAPTGELPAEKRAGETHCPTFRHLRQTRQGCQKVAGGRSGRKGADHRNDARIAMHLGEVPETALPVWKLVSLPALSLVVWHPWGMQTDRRPRTGGRFPCHPGTTHRLPSVDAKPRLS